MNKKNNTKDKNNRKINKLEAEVTFFEQATIDKITDNGMIQLISQEIKTHIYENKVSGGGRQLTYDNKLKAQLNNILSLQKL